MLVRTNIYQAGPKGNFFFFQIPKIKKNFFKIFLEDQSCRTRRPRSNEHIYEKSNFLLILRQSHIRTKVVELVALVRKNIYMKNRIFKNSSTELQVKKKNSGWTKGKKKVVELVALVRTNIYI